MTSADKIICIKFGFVIKKSLILQSHQKKIIMRRFNVTGICVPEMHYMVDISEKIEKIFKLVEAKDYFTINRGRQYGKTTTIGMLEKRLPSDYL